MFDKKPLQRLYYKDFTNGRITKFNLLVRIRDIRKQKDRDVKERLKLIGGGYPGSRKEFKETVLTYWDKYGFKPNIDYYRLYCVGKDSFDPRYITDPVWICYILPYFNDLTMRRAYDDKGMYHRLFTGVKHPDTVIKRMGGYFYNGDGEQLISAEDAKKLCLKEEALIFKPALDSSKGKGIKFYDRTSCTEKDLDDIIAHAGNNFVAQRLVRQHPYLSTLNESSLNTIRVITFHFKGEVHVLSALLRIGADGAKVDNTSAGGSAVPIRADGRLYEKSVNRKSEWVDETAKGVKYRDIQVPNFADVVDTAKRLHCQLPHLNIIGWDFAVGEDGTPILVEFNVRPEQNQISCGPTFGDMTDEVLDEAFIKKTLRH
jgi:hypothetical protein